MVATREGNSKIAKLPRAGAVGLQRNQKKAGASTLEAFENVSTDHEDLEREIEQYVGEITSGKKPACRFVRLACERYGELRGRYEFRHDLAARSIHFIESHCRHSIGEWAGQPFELADWQKFIVWNLFGFYREDGLRLFRYALISVARKNGKSTFAAAIILLMTLMDGEPRPQIYLAATKVEQASIVIFDEVCHMIRLDPSLSEACLVYQNKVTCPAAGSMFKMASADKPFDGLNPHLIVLDELHAWREVHRRFFGTMKTGGGSRRQPMLLIITTSGDDTSTIYNEEIDYSIDVLEGLVDDDEMFCFYASLDPEDNEFDEDAWIKANPNLDVCCKRDYLHSQATKARAKPSFRNEFLRYHCNRRTASSERILSPEDWAACEGAPSGDVVAVHGGIDLARSRDFAAWAIVREHDNHEYELITRTYTCQERSRELSVAFVQQWIDAGYLFEHSGNQLDFDSIERDIIEASHEYDVSSWAYDPTYAQQIAQHLQAEFGEEAIFKFPQTHARYNEPFRKFEEAVIDRRVRHDGNPCLSWQAANLMVDKNAKDHWMPMKGADRSKIDVMVAILMGLSECLFAEREMAWSDDEIGV